MQNVRFKCLQRRTPWDTEQKLIEGITEKKFLAIQDPLKDIFNYVTWEKDTLVIDSHGNHHSDYTTHAYDLIAQATTVGGDLEVTGEEALDFSIVFFAPGQWKQVHAEVVYPECPF